VTPEKVIVGLSGGVDSAVAAMCLKSLGYQVEALFMKNWDEDDGTEYCTAQADFEDAARVADHLGIELHAANFAAEYWDNVFERFLTDYAAGRTPNPDVLCNREIKFKVFLDYAKVLGARRIATGHYVRGVHTEDGFELHKGVDANKDQSYFLQSVPIDQLSQALFPLGEMVKDDVRRMAKDAGLHNFSRKDSTGICFIGERRFRDFLARYLPTEPGEVITTEGARLGEHVGLAYYTLGQRQGLGIGGRRGALDAPWYVVGKNLARNQLLVSQHERDLENTWLVTANVNWLSEPPDLPAELDAKVRYRQPDQRCTVLRRADGKLLVSFEKPQRAVTPGQYVCFYTGTQCLGGGLITARGSPVRHGQRAVAAPAAA
jgi:tRNA-specific 2-thiouridylase